LQCHPYIHTYYTKLTAGAAVGAAVVATGAYLRYGDIAVLDTLNKVKRKLEKMLGFKKKKIRVYMDGCFDMMHYGHANALRQAAALGDELVIGLVPDDEIIRHKGPPVFNDGERRMAVEAVKWVDEVITGVPYEIHEKFMEELFTKHNIDYIVHGDDPCFTAEGKDAYGDVKEKGKYLEIKRTEGVSTTDIVGRMLMCTRSRQPSTIHEEALPDLSPLQKQFSENSDKDDRSPVSTRVSSFMPTSRRIVQFSNSVKIAADARVVYVDGSFDVFHPGHISVLRDAKERGDFLLVGVWPDDVVSAERGSHFPILNVHERALSVLACCYVDEVVIGAPRVVTPELIATFNISKVMLNDLDELHGVGDDEAYAVPKKMGILEPRQPLAQCAAHAATHDNDSVTDDGQTQADTTGRGGWHRRTWSGNLLSAMGKGSTAEPVALIGTKRKKGEGLENTYAEMTHFVLSRLISRIVANRKAFEIKFAKKSVKEKDYVDSKTDKAFVQEV